MNYREAIDKYFDANWFPMMKDIARIVSINSEKMPAEEGMPFGRGPYEALQEFFELAKEHGFEPKNYDNYVGAIDLNDKEKQLDILAHLDVVPAGEGWTVCDPFEPVIKDGRIYGRGTADDKGPAIVAMYAMKCVRDLGIELTKNARLIVGTDEECGSGDIPHYYAVEEEAPMTFSPDAEYPVINIEKGSIHPEFRANWEEDKALPRVVSIDGSLKVNILPGKACAVVEGLELAVMQEIAAKVTESTKVEFELVQKEELVYITAVGYGAHAASPWEGNNALTALIEYLCALPLADSEAARKLASLNKLFPHGDSYGAGLGVDMEDAESGKLTLVFSMMKWGLTGFVGQYDCRAPICANNENMRDVAEKALADEGIVMDHDDMHAPHYVPAESPFVQELLKVYEDYTGLKGECIAIGGGTYVHHLKNGVAFGCAMPGTDNKMHGADEFAVIEELILSAKMFAQIIIDLCQ